MPQTTIFTDTRAAMPSIGVTLMLGLTLVVTAGMVTLFLGTASSTGPAPAAMLEIDTYADDTIVIEHRGGDPIHAQRTTVKVAANGQETVFEEVKNDAVLSVGSTAVLSLDFYAPPPKVNRDTLDWDGNPTTADYKDRHSQGGKATTFAPGDTIVVTIIDREANAVLIERTLTA